MSEPVRVYLSRRNLMTLLAKLDGRKRGISSLCTLLKRDTKHKTLPQTHNHIYVTAVEDEDYYTDREPGEVLVK